MIRLFLYGLLFDDTGWFDKFIWKEQFEIVLPLNKELNELVLLSRENDLLLGIVISSESGCICFCRGSEIFAEGEIEGRGQDFRHTFLLKFGCGVIRI